MDGRFDIIMWHLRNAWRTDIIWTPWHFQKKYKKLLGLCMWSVWVPLVYFIEVKVYLLHPSAQEKTFWRFIVMDGQFFQVLKIKFQLKGRRMTTCHPITIPKSQHMVTNALIKHRFKPWIKIVIDLAYFRRFMTTPFKPQNIYLNG